MNYGIQEIHNHPAGTTDLYLVATAWCLFATIPWEKGAPAVLYLRPTDLAMIHEPVAPNVTLAPKDTMPALNPEELRTVIETVVTRALAIQAAPPPKRDD